MMIAGTLHDRLNITEWEATLKEKPPVAIEAAESNVQRLMRLADRANREIDRSLCRRIKATTQFPACNELADFLMKFCGLDDPIIFCSTGLQRLNISFWALALSECYVPDQHVKIPRDPANIFLFAARFYQQMQKALITNAYEDVRVKTERLMSIKHFCTALCTTAYREMTDQIPKE